MDVYEALADPLRRALLERLVRGPARVVDLTADHSVSRPAISRHLRLLSEAGLVSAASIGRERHYRLHTGPLLEVEGLIARLTPEPPIPESAFDALETEVHRRRREQRSLEETA